MTDIERVEFDMLINVMLNYLAELDIRPERDEVEAALARRQVKQLLVSEDLKLKRFAYKCNSCPREGERVAEEFEERDCECGGKEEVAEEEDVTQALLDEAERQDVSVEVFSRETQAGSEFHATFRGLGAFLKYK